jgi:hypothetical protein
MSFIYRCDRCHRLIPTVVPPEGDASHTYCYQVGLTVRSVMLSDHGIRQKQSDLCYDCYSRLQRMVDEFLVPQRRELDED